MFLFYFFIEINIFIYFSNHFQGQDILHIDVYDEDTIKNDNIGSLQIDLRDLYEKRIYY
jgi:Ca2+-dependent lipid-binding protein